MKIEKAHQHRITKNKKAMDQTLLGGNVVFYAAVIIIIAIQAALLGLTSANYYSINTRAPVKLLEDMRMLRPVYSQDCFAYYDENTQRVNPYYIDMERFNEKTFRECINFPENNCLKISLFGIKTEEYYNAELKDGMDMKKFQIPIAELKTQGYDDCTQSPKVFVDPVILVSGNHYDPAFIRIELKR